MCVVSSTDQRGVCAVWVCVPSIRITAFSDLQKCGNEENKELNGVRESNSFVSCLWMCVCVPYIVARTRSIGARTFCVHHKNVRLYFYLLLSFLTRLTFLRCCHRLRRRGRALWNCVMIIFFVQNTRFVVSAHTHVIYENWKMNGTTYSHVK